MSLNKPYFRIVRPGSEGYYEDPRYANDRISLCRGYYLIINDLKKIFEYVEPSEENLNVYSHRIYELFLRTSTEFEANCKGILLSNGYNQRNLNIIDYFNIEKCSKLSEYSVKLDIWRSGKKIFEPFKEWKNGYSLKWYQKYNNVKHDRHNNFKDATLGNLLESMAGLLCILYSQFSYNAFFTYNECMMYHSDDEGYSFVDDSLFSIKEANSWVDDEKYDFNWVELSKEENPFNKFNFK
ncbi:MULTISPECIES: hypothetical protein [unclassified Dehalobacter]|uniref:hypothetical protein n=1 Tax=unclassified Dehalobacter TaxID=2635733 RepID=UPI000E6CCBB6|nr:MULTISPECIES: hypothetical protein [unclassified Dehalobacter]RJE46553.1 hypothetical protein A7K50_13310 [Dehalobacter sp. MCB1]TCX49935.1 hypothetical protein C1I36_08885 [Dehalobacter sp. 14DCB1]TCX54201.1 hypothetical protein C1I38_05420 [Dehalobacter sp. 12DCB1]